MTPTPQDTCSTCEGTGHLQAVRRTPTGSLLTSPATPCPDCGGTGFAATTDVPGTTTSVGLDFPRQQARVREVLVAYAALPHDAGAFAAALIEDALRRADEAQASGDIVAILEAYRTLTLIRD